MKFFIKTFGCRVNQIESESISNALSGLGNCYDEKDFDVLIVNSCCVTEKAEIDVIKYLKKSFKKKTFLKAIVTGCLVTVFKDRLKEIKGDIKCFPNSSKSNIVEYITGQKFDNLFKIDGFKYRTRAFVKVQDGCNLKCVYCIVPIARNEMISKPVVKVLDEIANLVLKGYKEIVLSGTRLGAYDDDGNRLNFLLKKISLMRGNFRIRLSSLEPMEINEEIADICSNSDRFCSYFHIPLQSGSDKILKNMKRSYTTDCYFKKINIIREKIKNVGIYSDIIVGFPGESDEDFADSLDFVKKMEFSGLHVFSYSKRPLTEAYKMEDVDLKVKKERSRIMHLLDNDLRKKFALNMIGKKLDSIVLREKKGLFYSLTTNFIDVVLKDKITLNSRAFVEIIKVEENGIVYGKL